MRHTFDLHNIQSRHQRAGRPSRAFFAWTRLTSFVGDKSTTNEDDAVSSRRLAGRASSRFGARASLGSYSMRIRSASG